MAPLQLPTIKAAVFSVKTSKTVCPNIIITNYIKIITATFRHSCDLLLINLLHMYISLYFRGINFRVIFKWSISWVLIFVDVIFVVMNRVHTVLLISPLGL